MNESKKQKLIVAFTMGAVILLVFLLFIMIYQLFAINTEKKRMQELKEVEQELLSEIEADELTLKAHSDLKWIIRRARELGYVEIDDVILDKIK